MTTAAAATTSELTVSAERTRREPAPIAAVGRTRPRLARLAVVAGVIAAGATTFVAAVASAAGTSFETAPGEAIPLAGFAQMTLIATVLGVVIARVACRRPQPRRAFTRTTIGLVVVSLLPDLLMPFDAASKAVLVLTHVVAAAIVIPTLAARLPQRAVR